MDRKMVNEASDELSRYMAFGSSPTVGAHAGGNRQEPLQLHRSGLWESSSKPDIASQWPLGSQFHAEPAQTRRAA